MSPRASQSDVAHYASKSALGKEGDEERALTNSLPQALDPYIRLLSWLALAIISRKNL